MAILILAEHDNHSLASSFPSLLAAGLQLGSDVHVLLAGEGGDVLAQQTAAVKGVGSVLLADAPYYAVPSAENMAALIADRARGYTHVLGASSIIGKAILPRAAALLDVAPVSDVIRILDAHTFVRPVHAGSLLATLRSDEPVIVLGIRCSEFDAPFPDSQLPAPIVKIKALPDNGLSFVEARILRNPDQPQLTSARVVVSGGRGFETPEDFQRLLEPLAKELNAAIGATREIVDAGVPNEYQVGQSAHTVAPELYLAIGLSGASQHVCGMKGSKVIVAINRDEHAPICQIADYVLVGNLYRQIPRLTEALKALPAVPCDTGPANPECI